MIVLCLDYSIVQTFDSLKECEERTGAMAQIMAVLALPPKEGCKMRVKVLSL